MDHDDADSVDGEENAALIEANDDVANAPSELADTSALVRRKIPRSIFDKFEVYSYRNAALILSETRKHEFSEIVEALESFTLTTTEIRVAGGNESSIPKSFSTRLRPQGWHETIIRGDLHVRLTWAEQVEGARGRSKPLVKERTMIRERFLDGHKIDYVKGRVAFDLEWNSKDQTFDRDLYAFSAFAQCGIIDAGILVTRSVHLNEVFRALGPALKRDGSIERARDGTPRKTIAKYGASTTWMGKLLYRLNAGRNGSFPVLALGILPKCVVDWSAL